MGLSPDTFRDELATSRTFLLETEAERASRRRYRGQDHRGRPFDLRPRRRHRQCAALPDECARHKILDLVGDLALLGVDLHGFVVAHRSGHQTNHALARRLLQHAADRTRPPSALCPLRKTAQLTSRAS